MGSFHPLCSISFLKSPNQFFGKGLKNVKRGGSFCFWMKLVVVYLARPWDLFIRYVAFPFQNLQISFLGEALSSQIEENSQKKKCRNLYRAACLRFFATQRLGLADARCGRGTTPPFFSSSLHFEEVQTFFAQSG